MKVNEMTLDECIAWLEEQHMPCTICKAPTLACCRASRALGACTAHDKFTPTLDGAAAAMPEGWELVRLSMETAPKTMYFAEGHAPNTDARWNSDHESQWRACIQTAYADTRILAEFRLSVACRMAMKEATR